MPTPAGAATPFLSAAENVEGPPRRATYDVAMLDVADRVIELHDGRLLGPGPDR